MSYRSPKIEADVVKLFFNSTLNRYITQDQFIAKKMNCDWANGICRDVGHGQARDYIEYMGRLKNHGLSIIDFKKSIIPVDLYDAPISMDGPTQILVAIGSLTPPPGPYGNLNMRWRTPLLTSPLMILRIRVQMLTAHQSLM